MSSKSIKEQIKDTLERVPVKDRRTWIVVFCVAVAGLSLLKTVVHIRWSREQSTLELQDTVFTKKMDALQSELDKIDRMSSDTIKNGL